MKNLIPFCLVVLATGVLLTQEGCDRGTRDWFQGSSHIKCGVSDNVTTHVQNLSAQDVTVKYCSPQFAISDQSGTFPAASDIKEASVTVGTHQVEEEVMMADSCSEASYDRSDKVGDLVPKLSAADQTSFKLCYNPASTANVSGTKPEAIYFILPIGSSCPGASQAFDPSTATCL